ncbi:MAG: phosphoenolpyruvate--protein phosphotransferase [Bacteroidetes bacterium]|nr:phosphoenolpyruvate--protein phosphotransferase [Bacteroidota bacterium]
MKGTGVSPGISIGTAYVIRKAPAVNAITNTIEEKDKPAEISNFDKAVKEATGEVNRIIDLNRSRFKPEDIAILETQTEFIGDSQIRSDVQDKILNENLPAVVAVREVIQSMVQMFGEMDDEYLRARRTDIQDAGKRIIKHLLKDDSESARRYTENTILIAEDISPTDALSIDTSLISGIATVEGGRTSHAAIIARSRGIPAVAGCGPTLMEIADNDTIILDGSTGDILVNPDNHKIEEYRKKKKISDRESESLKLIRDKPAITKDGRKIHLLGNISSHTELEHLFECGGEGVGLLRTELFFMQHEKLPSEEEQFEFYLQVAITAGKKPVIVRTLDIGGDKQVPFLSIPAESNPFLGYRAIRISLDRTDIFLTQIRAILRASVYGNLKIMLPMVSCLDELKAAKTLIKKAESELSDSGIRYNSKIETGIMLEIPSAALMTGMLSKESDFFSIGTNDLCQYTMAVDRMNRKVASLYDHFNPGFLRLLKTAIDQAHEKGKSVGMCGEMSSDPLAVILLLGMGLDEFSMPASSIPVVKQIINKVDYKDAKEIYNIAMTMESSSEIREYLQEKSK